MLVSISRRSASRCAGVGFVEHRRRAIFSRASGERSSWLALASSDWCERTSASMRSAARLKLRRHRRDLVAARYRRRAGAARRRRSARRRASAPRAGASAGAPPARRRRPPRRTAAPARASRPTPRRPRRRRSAAPAGRRPAARPGAAAADRRRAACAADPNAPAGPHQPQRAAVVERARARGRAPGRPLRGARRTRRPRCAGRRRRRAPAAGAAAATSRAAPPPARSGGASAGGSERCDQLAPGRRSARTARVRRRARSLLELCAGRASPRPSANSSSDRAPR